MQLPEMKNPGEYVGLYVVDFSETRQGGQDGQCAVGYTAEEVATLLDSEQFADVKVYRIHRAGPDGSVELHGVPAEQFQLESGMFFHCRDEISGNRDYQTVLEWNGLQAPPCRAKLQLRRGAAGRVLLAIICPAEYEHEMGEWLSASGFRGTGHVDAGMSQVERYYQSVGDTLQAEQLWPTKALKARDQETLLGAVGDGLQR